MSKASYVRGFVKAAKEKGVDPVPLIKFALSDGAEDALNFAGGATAGALAGTAASPLAAMPAYGLADRLDWKADQMENRAFYGLRDADPKYNELYRRHMKSIDASSSAFRKLDKIESELKDTKLVREALSKSKDSISKKDRLIHPFQYRRIASGLDRAGEKVQSLQDAASRLRAEANFHYDAARPLFARDNELRRIASKKILPRLVRSSGRLSKWLGWALLPAVGAVLGGASNVNSGRKERGSKPKNQPVIDNNGKQ